jgi:ABC-type branched-subunit amino acid transport system ATPase component
MRRVPIVLGAVALTAAFQPLLLVVLAPGIGDTLGTAGTFVGASGTLGLLAVAASALVIAARCGRHRRRWIAAGAFGWGVATMGSGVAASPWALAGTLVAGGVLTSTAYALHPPLLVDVFPARRLHALSIWRAGTTLGVAVALLAVAGLRAATWRAPFLVLGALAVLLSLGAWTVRAPAAEPSPLGAMETARRISLVPTARALLAVQSVVGMLLLPLDAVVLAHLDRRWGLALRQRTLVLAAFAMVAAVAVIVRSRRAERLAPAPLLRRTAVVFFAGVAATAAGALVPSFPAAVILLGAAFAAIAVTRPAIDVTLLEVVPPAMRSHAAALSAVALAIAEGLGGPLFIGTFAPRFGTGPAIALLALPGMAAVLLLGRAAAMVETDLEQLQTDAAEDEAVRTQTARPPMLACRHLDFAYAQVQVLFGVEFTVDDGEMVALLGTNGAGKSTLLRVISGLGLPSRGTVRFEGRDVTYVDAERRALMGITQVPGGRAVFGSMSVVENMRVFGNVYGRDRRGVERGVDAALDAFPLLAERRNQLASTLSGGEQQMLGLAKALIVRPRLLLIDELSLGLAPRIVGELLAMVQRINASGTAVVLVEQSVNVALSIVRHAYFMEKGEVRFDGAAADLLVRRDLLRSVFLEGASRGAVVRRESGGGPPPAG